MPNALVAHPIVFSAGTYNLRMTINAVTETRSFTVTAGRYYWTVGDGQADAATSGGVGDLLDRLRACIASHTQAGTVTVTLVNQRVRVTSTTLGTINLLWADAATTLDGRIFGWTTASSGASTSPITAPNLPQGLWVPSKPISEPDSRDRSVTLGGLTESLSGVYRVSDFGTAAKERTLSFRLLQRAVALDEYAASSAPYGTWEQAWSSIRRGRPFRVYPDAATLTSSAFTLYRTRSLTDPLTRDPSTILRWAVDLQAARFA